MLSQQRTLQASEGSAGKQRSISGWLIPAPTRWAKAVGLLSRLGSHLFHPDYRSNQVVFCAPFKFPSKTCSTMKLISLKYDSFPLCSFLSPETFFESALPSARQLFRAGDKGELHFPESLVLAAGAARAACREAQTERDATNHWL